MTFSFLFVMSCPDSFCPNVVASPSIFLRPFSCSVLMLSRSVSFSNADSIPYSSLDLMIEFSTVRLNAVVQSLWSQNKSSCSDIITL